MKLHVRLNQEDYIQFNIFHYFQSKSGKQSILLGRLFLFFITILIILVNFRSERLFPASITLLAISLFFFFAYPRGVKRNIRKNINKLAKTGELPYTKEADIAFSETEIIETSPMHTLHIPYASILNVHETDGYIYIMFGALQTLILPLRDIGDKKSALLALLREKCPHISQ